jgi:hypothetical protein
MDSLPTWALWSIVIPCVLVSPVIAFLLAIATSIVIGALVDAGASALVLVGVGAGAVLLLRKLSAPRLRASRSGSP